MTSGQNGVRIAGIDEMDPTMHHSATPPSSTPIAAMVAPRTIRAYMPCSTIRCSSATSAVKAANAARAHEGRNHRAYPS